MPKSPPTIPTEFKQEIAQLAQESDKLKAQVPHGGASERSDPLQAKATTDDIASTTRRFPLMGKRKGMLYEAIERLDSLMAIGQSRAVAKAEARARGESLFAFSDGKIHSYKTRTSYQAVVMRVLQWCRTSFGFNRLAQIDARAEELVSAYLREGMQQQKSAWTLKMERSALRCFFGQRDLAEQVVLPIRRRADIVRSRHPEKRNPHVQPEHWQPLIRFVLATGLRREELRDVRVGHVHQHADGSAVVEVVRGKGGKKRQVSVFPGREQDVLSVVEGHTPDERIFVRIPSKQQAHTLRRQFARELYEYYTGKPIPVREGGLRMADIDQEAALKVSRALGHNRIDVLIRHYLQ